MKILSVFLFSVFLSGCVTQYVAPADSSKSASLTVDASYKFARKVVDVFIFDNPNCEGNTKSGYAAKVGTTDVFRKPPLQETIAIHSHERIYLKISSQSSDAKCENFVSFLPAAGESYALTTDMNYTKEICAATITNKKNNEIATGFTKHTMPNSCKSGLLR